MSRGDDRRGVEEWRAAAEIPAAEKSGSGLGRIVLVLAVKALYELERTSGRYALVTMCIGGGQGIAALFERI